MMRVFLALFILYASAVCAADWPRAPRIVKVELEIDSNSFNNVELFLELLAENFREVRGVERFSLPASEWPEIRLTGFQIEVLSNALYPVLFRFSRDENGNTLTFIDFLIYNSFFQKTSEPEVCFFHREVRHFEDLRGKPKRPLRAYFAIGIDRPADCQKFSKDEKISLHIPEDYAEFVNRRFQNLARQTKSRNGIDARLKVYSADLNIVRETEDCYLFYNVRVMRIWKALQMKNLPPSLVEADESSLLKKLISQSLGPYLKAIDFIQEHAEMFGPESAIEEFGKLELAVCRVESAKLYLISMDMVRPWAASVYIVLP